MGVETDKWHQRRHLKVICVDQRNWMELQYIMIPAGSINSIMFWEENDQMLKDSENVCHLELDFLAFWCRINLDPQASNLLKLEPDICTSTVHNRLYTGWKYEADEFSVMTQALLMGITKSIQEPHPPPRTLQANFATLQLSASPFACPCGPDKWCGWEGNG